MLTAASAQAFVAAGFSFALRYLSRGATESSGDLSAAEAQAILGAGLALMAVQHVPSSGWTPSAALGAEYGANAAAHASAVGFPAGVSVWLDLEGVDAGTAASQVSDYCNAWYAAVAQAGFLPGLYVGASSVLSSEQLYATLSFQRYWSSGSSVSKVAQRGYCMAQTIAADAALAGVSYDSNLVLADQMGATPCWWAPPA